MLLLMFNGVKNVEKFGIGRVKDKLYLIFVHRKADLGGDQISKIGTGFFKCVPVSPDVNFQP